MMNEIVSLGTGRAQRRLLAGLDPHRCNRTAIVGVTDCSGKGAAIRRAMNIPHPGDARDCLAGQAGEGILKKLFDFRFSEGELDGLVLGDYLLAALTRIEGEFGLAVERAASLLGTRARVYPVATRSTHVCAELVTGWKITGESEIAGRNPRVRIMSISLEEPVPLYPPAARAVDAADLVVIGPGSLLTGILPILLTEGLREKLRDARARVAYVCNLMTQPGQTDGFSARDHVRLLEDYLNFNLDHVIVNSAPVPPELLAHFRAIDAEPVNDDLTDDVRAVRGDFLQLASLETPSLDDRPEKVFLLFHDSRRLGGEIMRLLD